MRPPSATGRRSSMGFTSPLARKPRKPRATSPGCVATVKMPRRQREKVSPLGRGAIAPVTMRTPDQRVFTLKLTRESWQLPYTITLNNFHHEVPSRHKQAESL